MLQYFFCIVCSQVFPNIFVCPLYPIRLKVHRSPIVINIHIFFVQLARIDSKLITSYQMKRGKQKLIKIKNYSVKIARYEHAYVRLLSKMGWKRVAALTEDGQKYTEYISHMEIMLKNNDIELISNKKFPREATSDSIRQVS